MYVRPYNNDKKTRKHSGNITHTWEKRDIHVDRRKNQDTVHATCEREAENTCETKKLNLFVCFQSICLAVCLFPLF